MKCWRCFRELQSEPELNNKLCDSCQIQRDIKAGEVLNDLYTLNLAGERPIEGVCLAAIAFSLEEFMRLNN